MTLDCDILEGHASEEAPCPGAKAEGSGHASMEQPGMSTDEGHEDEWQNVA